MKKTLAIATIMTLGMIAGFLPSRALAQVEPKKRPGPTAQPSPSTEWTEESQVGEDSGAPPLKELNLRDTARVDSTIALMKTLMEKAQGMSKSFGELATLHEGADRSEIVMMQHMSESLGRMAGDVMTTLEQYKRMLNDETASDTGTMKAEITGLKGVIDEMGGRINNALGTLEALQVQLGQS